MTFLPSATVHVEPHRGRLAVLRRERGIHGHAERRHGVALGRGALLGIAACLSSQGDQRQAMEHAVRAEEVARQAGAHTEIARALWAQGSASYRLGEGQEALSRAEQLIQTIVGLNGPHMTTITKVSRAPLGDELAPPLYPLPQGLCGRF